MGTLFVPTPLRLFEEADRVVPETAAWARRAHSNLTGKNPPRGKHCRIEALSLDRQQTLEREVK